MLNFWKCQVGWREGWVENLQPSFVLFPKERATKGKTLDKMYLSVGGFSSAILSVPGISFSAVGAAG